MLCKPLPHVEHFSSLNLQFWFVCPNLPQHKQVPVVAAVTAPMSIGVGSDEAYIVDM